jgi:integrase
MPLSRSLRQQEALGLVRSDIDLDDGTLRLRRSVQRHTWLHGCPTSDSGPARGVSLWCLSSGETMEVAITRQNPGFDVP